LTAGIQYQQTVCWLLVSKQFENSIPVNSLVHLILLFMASTPPTSPLPLLCPLKNQSVAHL
jgi:hypothetical protein